jgi:hypothetical protein
MVWITTPGIITTEMIEHQTNWNRAVYVFPNPFMWDYGYIWISGRMKAPVSSL